MLFNQKIYTSINFQKIMQILHISIVIKKIKSHEIIENTKKQKKTNKNAKQRNMKIDLQILFI